MGFLKNLQFVKDAAMNFSRPGTANITGFLFHLAGGRVYTIQFSPDREIPFRNGSVCFAADSRGCYFLCKANQPGRAAWINGTLAAPGKKYYLVNNDLVVLQELDAAGSLFFLFTILNQSQSPWRYIPQNILSGQPAGEGLITVGQNGYPVLSPAAAGADVYINHQKVTADYCLQPYDTIDVLDRHFVFTGRDVYAQEPLAEEFHTCLALMNKQLNPDMTLDINIRKREAYANNVKRMLLEDIRLTLHRNEMVLIIGGSGAGKTTFFNAVMATEKADATILLGQQDLYRNYESLKHMIGYVQQSDLLRPGDTVFDTLLSAAKMSLPPEIVQDPALLERRVWAVLNKLHIEKEAQSLVSKLSGGQRKRLCIAKEYISEPPLFFLDEPDTGLDSNQSSILMHNLRDITDTGKIVLVISHYPSRTPELFNKVLVLAKSQGTTWGRFLWYTFRGYHLGTFPVVHFSGRRKRSMAYSQPANGLPHGLLTACQWPTPWLTHSLPMICCRKISPI